MCRVRGKLSIVFVSVAAVGGGEQPHIMGGGVAPTTIVTGGGRGGEGGECGHHVNRRIFEQQALNEQTQQK